MYGAIIGDIIATTYDPDRHSDSDFYFGSIFYDRHVRFSDVTNTTIDLVETLMDAGEDEKHNELEWFTGDLTDEKAHPLEEGDLRTIASMSSLGWLYSSLVRTQEGAYLFTKITDSPPDFYLAAEMFAAAIYHARIGCGKDIIRQQIMNEFTHIKRENGYAVGVPIEQIIDEDSMVAIKNVREAVEIFIESESFEDAVKRAVRADEYNEKLLASMVGSIAEAFYGIPASIKSNCNKLLSEEMLAVIDRFENLTRRVFYNNDSDNDEGIAGNEKIEEAITLYQAEASKSNFNNVIKEIYHRMQESGHIFSVLKPAEGSEDTYDSLEYKIFLEDGQKYIVAFTSNVESFDMENDEPVQGLYESEFKELFEEIAEENEFNGVLLNRYGKKFLLTKDWIKKILSMPKPENELDVYIGGVTEIEAEAVVSLIDRKLNGIDSKIDEELHTLAGSKLRKMLKKCSYCNIGESIITKGYGLKSKYVIHFAVDDDLDNFDSYYQSCLEIAKENHLHSIALPITCAERSKPSRKLGMLRKVFLMANKAAENWFKKNRSYGLKVILAVEYEDQRIFKVDISEEDL